MSSTSSEHQARAADMARQRPVRCAVLTVSDTRTMENDAGGQLIIDRLERCGMVLADRAIVRDEPDLIRAMLERWLGDPQIDAALVTGGTGVARRDGTIDVVRSLLSVELEGFGELFRMLSWQHVKAAAMMSRAVGGLVMRPSPEGGDTLVFAMPGSPNAVEVAMDQLITPQLPHLVWERRR